MEFQSNLLVLVDDDSSVGVLVERRLAKSDWDLVCFTSGLAAIEYLSSHAPGVLLLDIRMPQISGDELLLELAVQKILHPQTRVLVSSSVEPLEAVWQKFAPFGAAFVSKDVIREKGALLDLLGSDQEPNGPTAKYPGTSPRSTDRGAVVQSVP